MDEAELFKKRVAYIDTLRGLYRRERLIGFLAVLAGAGLIVPSRFVFAWPHWVIWAGYGLIAVGWVLMIYVIWRRTQWRRANPFNPNV
ncbi:hypothetical protein [Caulobacter mirabilis]|uniref:2TM domain-containing protein n=1 Tax=Caulobacter mirabilis TaxID=69666 RepID=A0A2D2AYH4_9CAUL|nr:hypothetical protein [Caulobacter mirabilis]ATQ43069.1 hypothetical protein CSW64_11925 [Caulobacter mirabilis]